MKKIKLENIVDEGFDPETGKAVSKVTVEYVCEGCRHLVKENDKFCWQCGKKLKQSELVEHYDKGEKLTDEEFTVRRNHATDFI